MKTAKSIALEDIKAEYGCSFIPFRKELNKGMREIVKHALLLQSNESKKKKS